MLRTSTHADGRPTWLAAFERVIRRVTVEKVHYEGEVPCYYVTFGIGRVGMWPGLESPELIEYVPMPTCPRCGAAAVDVAVVQLGGTPVSAIVCTCVGKDMQCVLL